MQTTLVDTRSWVEASEARRDAGAFSSHPRFNVAPAKSDLTFKPRPSFTTPDSENNRAVIEAMVNSKIYQDYEKAFSEATGMPVTLRAVESWQLPDLSNCQDDTTVPVRLGDRLIGFLQARDESTMAADGLDLDETFFAPKDAPIKQHDSVVKLLGIFAQHLSMLSNQVVVQQKNSVPHAITRAKEYIQEHYSEDLSLGQVAKAVNTSTFYFCKLFKKATGINFTNYLSRVRIEKAKNLLLNPNFRISEIAFDVGFQSLTHFNRVFKKILGQSPTEYRAQLPGR